MLKKGSIASIFEDKYMLFAVLAILVFIVGSSVAFLSTSSSPSPVPEIHAIVKDDTVLLNWKKSDDAVMYDIYRSTEKGFIGKKIASTALLSYEDKVSPGVYYYTIRAVNAKGIDDGNQDQLEVVVSALPSNLSISTSNISNSLEVLLSLSAKNADECRYKNDEDAEWSEWEPYSTTKKWVLSEGRDGYRFVLYQCRNEEGLSDIASARILLDRTPPRISYVFTTTPFTIKGVVQDGFSSEVKCEVIVDSIAHSTTISLKNGRGILEYSSSLSAGEHQLSVRCVDEAGNVQETALQSFTSS